MHLRVYQCVSNMTCSPTWLHAAIFSQGNSTEVWCSVCHRGRLRSSQKPAELMTSSATSRLKSSEARVRYANSVRQHRGGQKCEGLHTTGRGGSRRGAHRATSSAFSNKASAAFVSGKFVAPEMAESGLSTPHTPACSTAREHVNVDAEHITAKQRVAWESKHGPSPRRRWNPGVIEIFVCVSVLKYASVRARTVGQQFLAPTSFPTIGSV